MSSDARIADMLQHNLRLLSKYEPSTTKIEMDIGHWYLDEFGNRTREIKACDAVEEVREWAQREPRDRTKPVRTKAERLAQLTAF
jgi:hypothetical protein